MKAVSINDIEEQLLEIDAKINELNVKNDFKKLLQEDLDLAKSFLRSQNILGVINCLLVIVGKLHTHAIAALCPCTAVEPLLLCIQRLLQFLIKLPVNTVGATGATGPIGPEGKPGPKGATGPAGCDGRVGATGATGPTGSPGPEGPMGATGPIGPSGTAHFISSCTIPICDYPVEDKKEVKFDCFDCGIYTQFVCKPKNPFH